MRKRTICFFIQQHFRTLSDLHLDYHTFIPGLSYIYTWIIIPFTPGLLYIYTWIIIHLHLHFHTFTPALTYIYTWIIIPFTPALTYIYTWIIIPFTPALSYIYTCIIIHLHLHYHTLQPTLSYITTYIIIHYNLHGDKSLTLCLFWIMCICLSIQGNNADTINRWIF